MCILLLYSVMQAVIKTCFFIPPTETSIIIVHLNSKLDPGGKSSIQSFGKVTLHLYRILKGNNDCTSPSQNAYTSQVINQAFLRLVLILNLLLKAFNGTKKKIMKQVHLSLKSTGLALEEAFSRHQAHIGKINICTGNPVSLFKTHHLLHLTAEQSCYIYL